MFRKIVEEQKERTEYTIYKSYPFKIHTLKNKRKVYQYEDRYITEFCSSVEQTDEMMMDKIITDLKSIRLKSMRT